MKDKVYYLQAVEIDIFYLSTYRSHSLCLWFNFNFNSYFKCIPLTHSIECITLYYAFNILYLLLCDARHMKNKIHYLTIIWVGLLVCVDLYLDDTIMKIMQHLCRENNENSIPIAKQTKKNIVESSAFKDDGICS